MLVSVPAAGGALLGCAYIALIVLPPISVWNSAHPGSDWQSGILWYFYLVAVVVGVIFGALTGVLAWLLGWFGRKVFHSLAAEAFGVGLGSLAGVFCSYFYWQLSEPRLRPIAYPLVIGGMAVLVLVSMMILVRRRQHRRQGMQRPESPPMW